MPHITTADIEPVYKYEILVQAGQGSDDLNESVQIHYKITQKQWDDCPPNDQLRLIAEVFGAATGYAELLALQTIDFPYVALVFTHV